MKPQREYGVDLVRMTSSNNCARQWVERQGRNHTDIIVGRMNLANKRLGKSVELSWWSMMMMMMKLGRQYRNHTVD
jgi:hypothetical protein